MSEVLNESNIKENKLSASEAKSLSWKIFWSMWIPAIWISPKIARKIARKIAIKFYDDIFKKLWINVNIKFSEDAKENFPQELEALNEYIVNWVISDENLKYISKLFFWNHTKWSVEATWAYYLVPTDTRIVLKDILNYILGVFALNPISFDRSNITTKATRKRNKKIRETIESWKRVLLYPEGTRTDNWEILNFKNSYTSEVFKAIKATSDEVSKIVTIITTDSHEVFPYTLEEGMMWKWNLWKWDVVITIDFIDASLYENVNDFNKAVKNIMENNLNKNKVWIN